MIDVGSLSNTLTVYFRQDQLTAEYSWFDVLTVNGTRASVKLSISDLIFHSLPSSYSHAIRQELELE